MMKILNLKLFVFVLCFTLHGNTNATIITYNDYSLNTETNIVTGGGLEWLQWDETAGQSINIALGTYSVDGWRLASNNNMSFLFNSFFPKISWDYDENTYQSHHTPWNPSEDSQYSHLVELFGNTSPNAAEYNYNPLDLYFESCGLFGSDADQDGYFNRGCAYDDYTYFDALINGPDYGDSYAYLGDDGDTSYYTRDTHLSDAGIVLVRSVSVPEPTTLAILGLGLFGLVLTRRKR